MLLPAGGFATIGNRLVARTVGQLGGGSEGVLPAAQAEACICRVGEMPQLVRNRTALCIQLLHSAEPFYCGREWLFRSSRVLSAAHVNVHIFPRARRQFCVQWARLRHTMPWFLCNNSAWWLPMEQVRRQDAGHALQI